MLKGISTGGCEIRLATDLSDGLVLGRCALATVIDFGRQFYGVILGDSPVTFSGLKVRCLVEKGAIKLHVIDLSVVACHDVSLIALCR